MKIVLSALKWTGGRMNPQLSDNRMSPNWTFVCGLFLAGAALKEVVARVAQSPVKMTPNRPSLMGTILVGAVVKDAVKKLGGAV
ncbi:MAG: hypothetical protein ACJ77Z_12180 [Thermoleophilaceae bacterium]